MAYGSTPPMKKAPMKKAPMKKAPMKKAKMPLRDLTPAQEKQLQMHKVHHTLKHMNKMKLLMREGKSFKQAHMIAQKMVGK